MPDDWVEREALDAMKHEVKVEEPTIASVFTRDKKTRPGRSTITRFTGPASAGPFSANLALNMRKKRLTVASRSSPNTENT